MNRNPQLMPPMAPGALDDLQRAHLFYDELQRGHFCLAFQPVVAAREPERVLYRESLLRHESGGLGFNPFPLLERLHVIRPLDHRVLNVMIDLLQSHPELTLGCNISALSTVSDPDWESTLETLNADPCVARRLTVEITESSVPPCHNSAVELVTHLRNSGCQVAVDDFGSGFGTLAFILQSQPDIIKIDQSYIQRARENTQGERTLVHLLELCKTLAPCVIVEGIETEADLQLAQDIGSEWLQGYLFGRPSFALADLPGIQRIPG